MITVKKGSARVKICLVSNRGKPLFMVTWFVAGRRHRRNFADEAEARKEAALVATKLSAGEARVLMLTSDDRESYLAAAGIGLIPLLRWVSFPDRGGRKAAFQTVSAAASMTIRKSEMLKHKKLSPESRFLFWKWLENYQFFMQLSVSWRNTSSPGGSGRCKSSRTKEGCSSRARSRPLFPCKAPSTRTAEPNPKITWISKRRSGPFPMQSTVQTGNGASSPMATFSSGVHRESQPQR